MPGFLTSSLPPFGRAWTRSDPRAVRTFSDEGPGRSAAPTAISEQCERATRVLVRDETGSDEYMVTLQGPYAGRNRRQRVSAADTESAGPWW